MLLADGFFSDGRPALVVWGTNNKLDGFNTPHAADPPRLTRHDMVPVLMILDPGALDGIAPPFSDRVDLSPADVWAYGFFDASLNGAVTDDRGRATAGVIPADERVSLEDVALERSDEGWALRASLSTARPAGGLGLGRVRYTFDRALRVRSAVVQPYERHVTDPAIWAEKIWRPVVQPDSDE
jgi:hypothetical protein